MFVATPKEYRGGVTDETYAETILKLSVRTLENWRRQEEFKALVDEIRLAQTQSSNWESWCMRQQTYYSMWDNMTAIQKHLSNPNRKKADDSNLHQQFRQYASEMMKLTDHAAVTKNTVRFEKLPDAELIDLMLRQDINAGMEAEKLAKAKTILTTPRTKRGGLTKEEEV